MAKSGKKRLSAKTRDAGTTAEAALGLHIYRSDPDIASGYPLVCNRRGPYPGANWADSENPIFPPHTAAQRWLATHGFHPTWWLPEALAEKWKTQSYPLKATIESVSQWRRLIETVADLHTHGRDTQEATELRRTLLADMENDFGLVVMFDRKLHAAADGPKSRIQQRDQFVYEEAMRGERYTSISMRLPGECAAHGWPVDECDCTASHCRQIAANYANANGLPVPDPR
jgi:hypothetical protein